MNGIQFHYVPRDDEQQHWLLKSCWCKPYTTWRDFETDELLPVPLIVHNSADCREIVEEATGDGFGGWELWQVVDAQTEKVEDVPKRPRPKCEGVDPAPEVTPQEPSTPTPPPAEPANSSPPADDEVWHDSCEDESYPDNWEDEGEDWKKAA